MLIQAMRGVASSLLAGALAALATAQDGGPSGRVASIPEIMEARSVPPASRPDDRVDRTVAYGLTYADFDLMKAMAGVAHAVPVRLVPRPILSRQRAAAGQVLGTTSEFANLAGLEVAQGRFLAVTDNARFENCAVLGSTLAEALFPNDDPIGKEIKVGTDSFTVVGVVRPRLSPPGIDGAVVPDPLDQTAYLPLSTCKLRFGERFLSGDPLRTEENQLTRIVFEIRPEADGAAVAAQARDDLRRAHPRGDVEVVAPRPSLAGR